MFPSRNNALGVALFCQFFFFLFFHPHTALGHQSSVVFLRASAENRTLTAVLHIADTDLYEALGLPAKQKITQADVERRHQALSQYLLQRVSVKNLGFSCQGVTQKLAFEPRSAGFFAVATLRFSCARSLEHTELFYNLFFDLDLLHQGVAVLEAGGQTQQHVFRNTQRSLVVSQTRGLWEYAIDYLRLGMEHIATGYDHLAFLLALTLVVGSLWREHSHGYALGHMLTVVTAFTLSHSLTILLSALDLVVLPSRFVESTIALSIGYVALGNIRGETPQRRVVLTFLFGLIHGLGFASVLRELGLPKRGLVLSLLSFNLGVEMGQILLLGTLLPFLVWLSKWERLSKLVVSATSWLLLGLSLLFFLERAFGME